jgi:hypothetical protein
VTSPDGFGMRLDDIWRAHRPYLVDLAFRMLGKIQDAEDAVQEAFTRLLRVDRDQIDDIRGWLVVVVSRSIAGTAPSTPTITTSCIWEPACDPRARSIISY